MYGENPAQYGKSKSDELEVYVTYKISVSNESLSIKMRLDEIVDYYDDTYELVPERSYIEIEKGENAGRYDIVLDTNSVCNDSSANNKVFIRGIGKADSDGIYLSGGQEANFYVTFRVQKEERDGEQWVKLGEKANVAEVNGYSTQYGVNTKVPNIGNVGGSVAGLVDINSTPGNQDPNRDIAENDADKAPPINIKLNTDDDANRVISGVVWEDKRTEEVNEAIIADGIMQENETKINGVTVQLVELMENGTEYVWREYGSYNTGTASVGDGTGSGTRKEETPIINYAIDGENLVSNIEFDENELDGTYAFKSFIPGKYIVRFIYGDGTTYDVTEYTAKYNGQDYKSTTDSNYQLKWYNSIKDETNISTARDNEARRLEVMAKTAYVDGYVDKVGNEETEGLWMCAETSKINVAVDSETGVEIGSYTIVPGSFSVNIKIYYTNENVGYRQFETINEELPDIFAASDFVISRAGANIIFELLALKKPMLLIPLSKKASRGDQILNARSFEKKGYAIVLTEEEEEARQWEKTIDDLRRVNITDANGGTHELQQLASIRLSRGPSEVRRVNRDRRVNVTYSISQSEDLPKDVLDDYHDQIDEMTFEGGYTRMGTLFEHH